MKFGLGEDISQKIISVFTKFSKIETVIIYGSRVKGNYQNGSDIGLTIQKNLNSNTLLKILQTLEELNLPYQFDLSIYHQIENKNLLQHIPQYGQILYKKH